MELLMRPIKADEVEQEVTQRDQFDTDIVGLAETLVREAHQNSVDGRSTTFPGPVVTRISFRSARAEDGDFWSNLLSPLDPHLRSCGLNTADINYSSPSLLIVEDFGTTGLIGAVDRKDDKNFSDFWRRMGRSHKRGSQSGRWGLGKLVYSSASRIRVFFAETIREGDPARTPYLMGQAVLRHHKLAHVDYAPHGFFAVPSTSGLQLPSADPELIRRFRLASGTTRSNEPGLSVIVPFPHTDLTPEAFLPHVVRNWFFPILTGQLIVDLNGILIDEKSFPDLAREHGGPSFENTRLVTFITQLEERAQNPPALTADAGWTAVGLQAALSEDVLEELREEFTHGRLVAIRMPLTLRPKQGPARETWVDVYLQSHGEPLRSDALYVRGALTIPGEARRFRGRSCFGALVASETAVAEFLGDAENPAHTSWSASAEKVKENWKNPSERLKEIRHALNYFYDAVAQPSDREDKDALIGIFHVKDTVERERPQPQRPMIKRPVVPPIPRSPAQYRIDPRRGGFAIRGTPDTTLPLELRVRVAYDVVSGDPLKKYDSLDFDLVRTSDIMVESEGAVPHIMGSNELRIEIHASSFQVTGSGFDMNRDLFVLVDKRS